MVVILCRSTTDGVTLASHAYTQITWHLMGEDKYTLDLVLVRCLKNPPLVCSSNFSSNVINSPRSFIGLIVYNLQWDDVYTLLSVNTKLQIGHSL